jgi:SOS-response transcriptional repressor LexA
MRTHIIHPWCQMCQQVNNSKAVDNLVVTMLCIAYYQDMHILQEKLLNLISEHNIGALTLRNIGARIGEQYPQKVKHHLGQLEKRGLITINKALGKIERAKTGRRKNSPLVSVPLVGSANCGPATIFADQNIEGYLKVSSTILGRRKNIFAIRASGPSMNKAAIGGNTIEDGDYLVVDPEDTAPRDRDIVLCIIDDTATVKRYVWDAAHKQIILAADSTKDFPPVYIHPDDNFQINGKIVQVIKKPKL